MHYTNNSALTEICVHLNVTQNKFKKEMLTVEVKRDTMYIEYKEALLYIQYSYIFILHHTFNVTYDKYLNNKAYYKIDTQSHATGVIAVRQRNAVIERQLLALRR